MRKTFAFILFVFLSFHFSTIALAQFQSDFSLPATNSGDVQSTSSGGVLPTLAPTPQATVAPNDFTKEEGRAANRLGVLVEEQQLSPLNPTNFLQYAVHRVVNHGVSATTVAFVLLFPLIACLIAFARHVIGLSGLSMYAPAALAVALLSLGVVRGTILFFAILLLATIGKRLLFGLKLPYLPRTAMILWVVSIGVFGLIILSTFTEAFSLSILNIFALLILILLSENFLEISGSSSPIAAIQSVLETFVLGVLCALLLGSTVLQSFVLLYPEISFLAIGALNIVIGKYLGLRFTEWLRFKKLTEEQE